MALLRVLLSGNIPVVTLVTSFTVNWDIMDVGIMRELALQISGIHKVVYTGRGRRQGGTAEPERTPDERPQAEPAAAG